MTEVFIELVKNLFACILFGVFFALGIMLLVAVWRGDFEWWTFLFFRRAALVGSCIAGCAMINAYVDED